MSDLTNQEKLEEVYTMAKENNAMLHSMLRQQYFAIALRVVYLLVIIGVIGGAYYYVRPVLSPIITLFASNSEKMTETLNQLNQLRIQLSDKNVLNEVLKTIGTQVPQK